VCSRPSSYTKRPSARHTTMTLSTTRRSPRSLRNIGSFR
jgi:hypothetical protein